MQPGLVSITFRKLTPPQVIELCLQHQLQAIEWGGDVHVPHGDEAVAAEVGDLTRKHGIKAAAYGSYYRLAASPDDGLQFSSVLASAAALGAGAIRVWAGNRSSSESDASWRQAVAGDAMRCADLAASKNVRICYEFHDGTLTDTVESACDLLARTEHPFIKTLWQPPHGRPMDECLAGLRLMAPRLHHVHAFHWWPDPGHRLPLREGADRWAAYVAELCALGCDPNVLLEFVAGDDPAALADDALFLRELLAICHRPAESM
ncbi:MAG: sugar phosphate isomerase/epimerase [Verrucomicrobiae bacterium]